MDHQGKSYKLEYDETVFDANISTIFKDEIVIVLRKRNTKNE